MNLKEFLERKGEKFNINLADGTRYQCVDDYISKYDLGLFFWERGGKQFAFNVLVGSFI